MLVFQVADQPIDKLTLTGHLPGAGCQALCKVATVCKVADPPQGLELLVSFGLVLEPFCTSGLKYQDFAGVELDAVILYSG